MRRAIEIESRGSLLMVQNWLEELRGNIEITDKKFSELSIIAAELSENIIKHCGKGKIEIVYHDSEHPYIVTVSENVGKLSERSSEDGISSKDSLGIGLGIVYRLSDEVFYEQYGKILQIRSIKYCTDFPSRTEVAVLSYPTLADDKLNGDAFLILKNKSDLLCVIDALGHGKDAHQSAMAALNLVKKNHKKDIDKLIGDAHEFLKNSHDFRGVMMSIIRIDYEANKILSCGLGDVMTKIFLPDEQKTLYPLTKDGIVGDHFREVTIQKFEIVRGAIIAVFTDGISSKIDIPLAFRAENLVRLVNSMVKKYGRSYDDRTLLLARIL
ncbi:SpoIIE family protein phosphatase [candidate division WOR-3 bacterium]|nr:SpoIIE family protein phosphatase [candidate division WOR-3 bacterium]